MSNLPDEHKDNCWIKLFTFSFVVFCCLYVAVENQNIALAVVAFFMYNFAQLFLLPETNIFNAFIGDPIQPVAEIYLTIIFFVLTLVSILTTAFLFN